MNQIEASMKAINFENRLNYIKNQLEFNKKLASVLFHSHFGSNLQEYYKMKFLHEIHKKIKIMKKDIKTLNRQIELCKLIYQN